LREYKFWKDSKKGWRSEGVAEIAVVRYSSTSSFGGFGLFEEDCAEDDMARDKEKRRVIAPLRLDWYEYASLVVCPCV
jgi:hypothetical protein